MSKFVDRIGEARHYLAVENWAGVAADRHHLWLCRCHCGNTCIVSWNNIQSGNTKSCGCLNKESSTKRNTTHGLSKTATYRSWYTMIRRCTDMRFVKYNMYGAKGIQVCQEWAGSFENFFNDMGYRPEGKTLERINNLGNYESANCRWATPAEQSRNTKRTRLVTINGQTRCVKDWAKYFGKNYGTVLDRLKRGWDAVRALTEDIHCA